MGLLEPHGGHRRRDGEGDLREAKVLPHWIGIPGVILLIALIAYGFRRGLAVKSPKDGGGSGDHGHSPPPDSDTPTHG
ncbi:hypothetical protein EOW77_0017610 [Bradyrhizobium yuanmingense]|nr:hypothetical protein EOW77_0017610 [Bradyrhizobium yuanmingense]